MSRLHYTQFAQVIGLMGAGLLASSIHAMPSQAVPTTTKTPAGTTEAPASAAPAAPASTTPAATTATPEATQKEVPAPGTSAEPLTPPTEDMPKTTEMPKTIVDVAGSNESFKTLTAAIQAAGLTETLSAEGPYTVFAPTDAAFAALPKGTVEKLLKPENKQKLIQLLTYHVVSGIGMSETLKSGQVQSVEGQPITLKVDAKGVMVNNAKVTTTDIKASNGVIHAIDKVILPPKDLTAAKPKPYSSTKKSENTTMPGVSPDSKAAPATPVTKP
ncbi:fasciclin domain-containing protein [Alkalinema pantanalense CENA528]|uniref:fasciclin domain-containing protein n=1 Tax=Alkalinema pantanalense TaxID=1620705 RepID=UPI003D6EFC56